MTGVVAAGTATVSSGETFAFWVLAITSVGGAIGMLLSRKAVHCALWIALTMVSLAGLYLVNVAPFLSMVQVIVYTGAVMMLFLFVLMLVGVDASDSLVETLKGQRLWALLIGGTFAVLIIGGLADVTVDQVVGLDTVIEAEGGNVQALASLIFGRYVFVFELTIPLLITAALGAMVLAHRERLLPKPTQRLLSERRFAAGSSVPGAPLPSPGVYARHNAVDVPALLPDGSPAPTSLPGPKRDADTVRTFTTADGRAINAASDSTSEEDTTR